MNDNEDVIDIKRLANGDYRYTTDPISPANHQSAEQMFRSIARLAGGELKSMPRHSKQHKHQHKQKVRQR